MFTLKYLVFICIAVAVPCLSFGQKQFLQKRSFYIVRHAEKDTGNNPAISAAGKKRAGDLYRELKNKKIDLIFVSQFRRTAMTADSLRIYKNIDSVHYTADAASDLLFKQINASAAKAKNILIIGHSNTLPSIIRKAGVENYIQKEIPDHEYDNLFIVKQKKGKAVLHAKKYGVVSVLPAKVSQMKSSQ